MDGSFDPGGGQTGASLSLTDGCTDTTLALWLTLRFTIILTESALLIFLQSGVEELQAWLGIHQMGPHCTIVIIIKLAQ